MDDTKEKIKKNRLRVVCLLAFIFSLTGAILLFAEDFLEWYNYPSEYGWIHIDSEIYGPIIIMVASFLLICAFISIVGLLIPHSISRYTFILGDFIAMLVFLMAIIGILIAASDLEEMTSWNPDAGFYGAVIGGLLTMIFFSIGFVFLKGGSVQEIRVPRPKTQVKSVKKANFCHKCGKEISGQFCTYCGTEQRKIQESKVSASAAPKVEQCSKCGKEVSGQFCTYCGANLNKTQEQKLPESTVPNVKYCSKCGKEVSGKFCTYCGSNWK